MTRSITINSYLNTNTEPRYNHNCDQCRFIGQLEEFDLYICRNTIILRYSSEPSEYGSYEIEQLRPEYWTTRHCDNPEWYWNEKYLVLIRELYKNKFITVKISL